MKINEIFYSVQGEGQTMGYPTIFIRTSGCNLRCAWCFSSGAEILMGDFTRKRIEDISEGDVVLGVKDRKIIKSKVLKKLSRTTETITIKFEDGMVLKCTPEHKFKSVKQNHDVRAENLKIGYKIESLDGFEWNSQYALGYLLGALEGDGIVWEDTQGYLHLRLESIDLDFVESLEKAAKNVYVKPDLTTSIWTNPRKTASNRTVFDFGITGQGEIKVLKELLASLYSCNNSKEFKRGFVAGFFDAEGSFSGHNLVLYNFDKKKLEFVKSCLDDFGFRTKIKYGRSARCVEVMGNFKDKFLFFKTFAPKIKRKYDKLCNRLLVSSPVKVASKEPSGFDQVYNIKTEAGNYFAGGFYVKNCDTAYAYEEGKEIPIPYILKEVGKYKCRRICLTGGEPLAQNESIELVRKLLNMGYEVDVETNGSVSVEPLLQGVPKKEAERLLISLDLKTPSSGMKDRNDYDNVARLRQWDQLKFIVTDKKDYVWVKKALDYFPPKCRVYLHPVGGADPKLLAKMAEWVLEDNLDVSIGIQLHKVIWGNERGR